LTPAAIVFGEDFYLFIVHPDRVREPNVAADPVHFLHVPNRTMTEFFQTKLFLVFGLGEMRVKMHSIFTRKFGGLFHQFARHAEWRTRREDDLHHRAGFGIVIFLDDALRVFEDGLFIVHHAVGRETAFRFAQRHRAARGVEAESDLRGRGNLIVEF
jgi:hypothetical protein